MNERGPERRDERPSFSPAATVVFAGIAAATVTMAASSAMKHARQNASGFSEVQGRVDHAPVARNESEIQNPKKGSSAVQKQMGVVSSRVQAVSDHAIVGNVDAAVFDGGSRVGKGVNNNGGRFLRGTTNRNSDKVSKGGKVRGESHDSDLNLSLVEDVRSRLDGNVGALNDHRLRAVVRDAVEHILITAPSSKANKFELPEINVTAEDVDGNEAVAAQASDAVNELRGSMREGVHYKKVRKTGSFKPTSVGAKMLDKKFADEADFNLASVVGAHMDEFDLGGQEMRVGKMIKTELSGVFAERSKARDLNRSGKRELLAKQEFATDSFDETYDVAAKAGDSWTEAEALQLEQDLKTKHDAGYVEWVEGMNSVFDDENVARSGGSAADLEGDVVEPWDNDALAAYDDDGFGRGSRGAVGSKLSRLKGAITTPVDTLDYVESVADGFDAKNVARSGGVEAPLAPYQYDFQTLVNFATRENDFAGLDIPDRLVLENGELGGDAWESDHQRDLAREEALDFDDAFEQERYRADVEGMMDPVELKRYRAAVEAKANRGLGKSILEGIEKDEKIIKPIASTTTAEA